MFIFSNTSDQFSPSSLPASFSQSQSDFERPRIKALIHAGRASLSSNCLYWCSKDQCFLIFVLANFKW